MEGNSPENGTMPGPNAPHTGGAPGPASLGPAVPALGRGAIAAHPGFLAAEQQIAAMLLDVQAQSPRTARLMASYRKWLVTHTLFALTVREQPDGRATALTPGELADTLKGKLKVNRNTLSLYIRELEAYGFLSLVDQQDDGRRRLIKATTKARQGMRRWYDGHLACLDRLDGGNRLAISESRPTLIFKAQPRMIAHILADEEWLNPTPSMACFLDSDVGGMLVHYMISRLPAVDGDAERLMIEEVGTAALADRFMISVSNIKRMVSRAEADGWLGWEFPRRRGRLWVSPRFVTDHFRRQAIKFELVDRAFREACAPGA